MRFPRMMTQGLGSQGSGRWGVIAEYTIVAALSILALALVGFLDFRRYQPLRGTDTVDQLVARLPETLKFAVVEQGDRSYVIWIGKPRGMMTSGPPVYVFDSTGTIVDRVYDAGESDNKFVQGLYVKAFHAPTIMPQQAVSYCRQQRADFP
jgi:hypothetical protein